LLKDDYIKQLNKTALHCTANRFYFMTYSLEALTLWMLHHATPLQLVAATNCDWFGDKVRTAGIKKLLGN